jgi:hypothetical protein
MQVDQRWPGLLAAGCPAARLGVRGAPPTCGLPLACADPDVLGGSISMSVCEARYLAAVCLVCAQAPVSDRTWTRARAAFGRADVQVYGQNMPERPERID